MKLKFIAIFVFVFMAACAKMHYINQPNIDFSLHQKSYIDDFYLNGYIIDNVDYLVDYLQGKILVTSDFINVNNYFQGPDTLFKPDTRISLTVLSIMEQASNSNNCLEYSVSAEIECTVAFLALDTTWANEVTFITSGNASVTECSGGNIYLAEVRENSVKAALDEIANYFLKEFRL